MVFSEHVDASEAIHPTLLYFCRCAGRYHVNDYAHLLHLALSGQAVTEVPPFLAYRPIQDGLLAPVLRDYPMPEVPLRALVVETRSMPALVRQFLDFAVERLPVIIHPR